MISTEEGGSSIKSGTRVIGPCTLKTFGTEKSPTLLRKENTFFLKQLFKAFPQYLGYQTLLAYYLL